MYLFTTFHFSHDLQVFSYIWPKVNHSSKLGVKLCTDTGASSPILLFSYVWCLYLSYIQLEIGLKEFMDYLLRCTCTLCSSHCYVLYSECTLNWKSIWPHGNLQPHYFGLNQIHNLTDLALHLVIDTTDRVDTLEMWKNKICWS